MSRYSFGFNYGSPNTEGLIVDKAKLIEIAARRLCELRGGNPTRIGHCRVLVRQALRQKVRQRDQIVLAIQYATNQLEEDKQ